MSHLGTRTISVKSSWAAWNIVWGFKMWCWVWTFCWRNLTMPTNIELRITLRLVIVKQRPWRVKTTFMHACKRNIGYSFCQIITYEIFHYNSLILYLTMIYYKTTFSSIYTIKLGEHELSILMYNLCHISDRRIKKPEVRVAWHHFKMQPVTMKYLPVCLFPTFVSIIPS